MRVLVIGAGAIGGVTAGILSRKGYQVEIACKNPELAEIISTQGIRVKAHKKHFKVAIPSYAQVKDTPGNYNYVLLATKANHIIEPAKQLQGKLTPQGLVVSLQDGYCEETLARIVGSNRVVGAVVGWGATMHAPDYMEMTSSGEMLIGKLDGKDDPRLDELEYMLSAVVPTTVVANINEHIYSKMVLNSCVTALGAISGLRMDAMLASRTIRNLFIKVIEEAIVIANAIHLDIPDYAGKLNYYRLVRGKSWYHRFKRHAFIRLFGMRYRKVKSSGLQSLERGEKTETEFLNGYIVNKGKELGIDVPVNELLLTMIREIEAGKRTITPLNFTAIPNA